MRRHETDWISLTFGGLFLVVAAVHLGTEGNGDADSLRWFVPAVLVVLGALGLAGALRGREPQTVSGWAADPHVADPAADPHVADPAADPHVAGWATDADSGPVTRDDGTEDTLRL